MSFDSDIMSNFLIDAQAGSKAALRLAVDLAFMQHSRAVGYAIADGRFVVYWCPAAATKPGSYQSFPYSLDAGALFPMLIGWLEQQKPQGKRPDIDGDVGIGWRLHNIDMVWAVLFALEPAWKEIHK